METITENTKRGRGRPRSFLAGFIATLPAGSTKGKTSRGKINDVLAGIALAKLVDTGSSDCFAWLYDAATDTARTTVLVELGRLSESHGDDTMCKIAAQLCAQPPKTTREAAAMIRRWRLGGSGNGDAKSLAKGLVRAIADYAACYPGTTTAQVLDALNTVYIAYKHAESDSRLADNQRTKRQGDT